MSKDFLYISSLSQNGEFEIQLPIHADRGFLGIEIKKLITYLPLPDQNKIESSNINIKQCEKLVFNPINLINSEYCFGKFLDIIKSKSDNLTNEEFYESLGDLELNNLFREESWNELYFKIQNYDVILLLEYGNDLSRLKKINYAMQCSTSNAITSNSFCNNSTIMYLFKYPFNIETSPQSKNEGVFSVIWNKFFKSDYDDSSLNLGIPGMIRFALYDFGQMQQDFVPNFNTIQIKRNGFGFILNFPELGTFLSCTVITGRFPYVVSKSDFSDNKLILEDRDYGENIEQPVLCLRKINSRIVPDIGDYKLNITTAYSKFYRNDFTQLDVKSSRLRNTDYVLDTDFIFDCPFSLESLCEIYKMGNSNLFPVQGGFSIIYNIFYCIMYYTYLSDLSINDFILTPIMLFNFMCGTIFPYSIANGMSSLNKENVKKKIYYAINPQFNSFIRLINMYVYKNVRLDKAYSETKPDFFAIGLTDEVTDRKYILNKFTNNYQYGLLQIDTSDIEQDLVDRNNLGDVVFLVQLNKPILINEGFNFIYRIWGAETVYSKVKLKFEKFLDNNKRSELRFHEGDKVLIKGTFQVLS